MSEILKKFLISDEDPEEPELLLGEESIDIEDIDGDTIAATCELSALSSATLEDFPDRVLLRIHSPDGFGTFLFHEAEIGREAGASPHIDFVCNTPNKIWEGTWGLSTLLAKIRDESVHFPNVSVVDVDLEDDWKRLTLRFTSASGAAAELLRTHAETCLKLMKQAEVALGGMSWKPEHSTNERAFCEDVLSPLLRRMGFLSVRYIQGAREYGKDFTFSELTPFGFMRHYGLQAKAGDVSGQVNSAIDELIGQVSDAFSMPYYELGSHEPRYISSFAIAISGKFTANAREKIVHKIPKGLHGSVIFLDREILQGLIDRYWKTS